MFFNRKKPPQTPMNSAPPPPWENIDSVPRRRFSIPTRRDIVEFTSRVTGFGRLGSYLFLLAMAAAFCFLAYVLYLGTQKPHPLPPHAHRPAIDAGASSTKSL